VGIIVTEGFPFSATVVFPSNLPLAYINQIKAIVNSKEYRCQDFFKWGNIGKCDTGQILAAQGRCGGAQSIGLLHVASVDSKVDEMANRVFINIHRIIQALVL
jgi:hypothetical protein